MYWLVTFVNGLFIEVFIWFGNGFIIPGIGLKFGLTIVFAARPVETGGLTATGIIVDC